MTRNCKNRIDVLEGTKVFISDTFIRIGNDKDELKQNLVPEIKVTYVENKSGDSKILGYVEVLPLDKSKKSKSLWGTYKSIINNMLKGAKEGYKKRLEIIGVGYRASVSGNIITLALGKSHDIKYILPKDVSCVCEKPTLLVLSGISKERVGQIASEIKRFLRPDPYKGKGIYEEGAIILRKEGKKK